MPTHIRPYLAAFAEAPPLPAGTCGLRPTPAVQRTIAAIAPYLRDASPLLLSGPKACGKAVLLRAALETGAHLHGATAQVAALHCSAADTAASVLAKLAIMCGKPVTAASGKVLRPRGADRAVLIVKDVDLPTPDKYGTCQLVELLTQLVTYGGFYDSSLEFIRLERVQIIATTVLGGGLGHHTVSQRFTGNVRVAAMPGPGVDDLADVAKTMLGPVVATLQLPPGSRWGTSAGVGALADAMVAVYGVVRGMFAADERQMVQFNPRHLATWVAGLLWYSAEGGEL